MNNLFKFGTKKTGFTEAEFGPFKCGHCKHIETLADKFICNSPEVLKDPDVPEDSEGNKLVRYEDCCNDYYPVNEEDIEMIETQKAAGKGVDEVLIFCPLVKVDAAKREVWGVVTAEYPDKEGEICDYDTTVPYYKALVTEMSKATGGENIFPLRAMHGMTAAGKGISIEFKDETKEVYMGFKVVDDAEWKKVEENVYTGFSQGGRYIKRWKDGEFLRYTAQPIEVSLVDLPCLTRAHFDYVKADGTTEVRKFKSMKKDGEISDVDICSCDCTQCKGGKCEMCMGENKCEMSQKANVKYLVTDKTGKKYLPYTKNDGKPNRSLMAQAWFQLNDGFKGAKYDGPDKMKALKRLKQLFAQQGMDNPSERLPEVGKTINSLLTNTIQNHAYGRMGKGMYSLSRFAEMVEEMKYLWLWLEYEREEEGDESPATDSMKEILSSMLEALLSYAEECVEETQASLAAR